MHDLLFTNELLVVLKNAGLGEIERFGSCEVRGLTGDDTSEAWEMGEEETNGKLRSGQTVKGTFIEPASAMVVEVIGCAGMDFVVIDMDHGGIHIETAENMICGAQWAGIDAVVRAPCTDSSLIGKLLDAGAEGTQVLQSFGPNTPIRPKCADRAVYPGKL